MVVDNNLLEQLLHEEEGPELDFKRDQYPFAGANDVAKSELLKDVLAFSNTWRRATAYILIGVQEVRGGRGKVVGVKTHLDDADLQQFVNSKTNRHVDFSYRPFRIQGVEIGVIEIPIQKRPSYLDKDFGKVRKHVVYKRIGSSTGSASPDEIAQMGSEQVSAVAPQLVLEWADIGNQVPLPTPYIAKTLILRPSLHKDTFEALRPRHPMATYYFNSNYSREIISYSLKMAFLKPMGLRLTNPSAITGKRIRFVGSVPKGASLVVRDRSNRPRIPRLTFMDFPTQDMLSLQDHLQDRHDPKVKELPDMWEITIPFGDIFPQDETWTDSELLIGSTGGSTKLEGELRGENLPEPISCSLEINFEVEERPMERSDVEPHIRGQ